MAERANTTLVTFEVDIYPYCKGDCVELTDLELEHVDKVAKVRDISKPYSKGEVEVSTPSLEEQEVARLELQKAKRLEEAEAAAAEKKAELDKAAAAAGQTAEEVAKADAAKAEAQAKAEAEAKAKADAAAAKAPKTSRRDREKK